MLLWYVFSLSCGIPHLLFYPFHLSSVLCFFTTLSIFLLLLPSSRAQIPGTKNKSLRPLKSTSGRIFFFFFLDHEPEILGLWAKGSVTAHMTQSRFCTDCYGYSVRPLYLLVGLTHMEVTKRSRQQTDIMLCALWRLCLGNIMIVCGHMWSSIKTIWMCRGRKRGKELWLFSLIEERFCLTWLQWIKTTSFPLWKY